jgi:CHAT domain-containing protein/tetratricopeptide (TPR) repeat protein
LISLGECYQAAKQYADAASMFERAFDIRQKALGSDHPAVAKTVELGAGLRRAQGRYAEAEGMYRRALSGLEKALGPDHPDTVQAVLDMAANYLAWDKPDQAAPLFDRGMDSLTRRLASGVAYMSERDRLDFLRSAPDVYPLYYSFAYAYHDRKPELAGKMYDLLLAERGYAASSAAALRAKIFATGDKQALDLFDQLSAKKTQLAAMASAPQGDPEEWRKSVSQLQQESNDIEENLSRRSAALKESKAAAGVTWRDVQKALQPGEAALEYVRFEVDDGKARTGRNNYAALVLTREGAPKLIALGEGVKDEGPVMDLYQVQSGATRGVKKVETAPAGSAAAPVTTPEAYNIFWKPIEPALAGVKRVYVASDGILNQFPIGLFPDGTGKYLMEKYDIRQLNSTKDLLRSATPPQSKTAVLMGNPNFELTEAAQRAALAKIGGSNATAPAQGLPGVAVESAPADLAKGAATSDNGKLPPLPGTQGEVEAIAKTFQTAGWQVTTLTGDLALEEALMRQRGPRVLHIATHGFFLSSQQIQVASRAGGAAALHVNDPMVNSGLFFAGADRALSGVPPAAGLEDGVLTSAEATQLDLQGSELVVLSACETGRGQQQNGEGVFGLRRALEEAGASAVLMSMWPVPDRETQELMALFYGKWLGGADKHDALRQAQFEERAVVRQRYGKDLPFYWGAFVLVGR